MLVGAIYKFQSEIKIIVEHLKTEGVLFVCLFVPPQMSFQMFGCAHREKERPRKTPNYICYVMDNQPSINFPLVHGKHLGINV